MNCLAERRQAQSVFCLDDSLLISRTVQIEIRHLVCQLPLGTEDFVSLWGQSPSLGLVPNTQELVQKKRTPFRVFAIL